MGIANVIGLSSSLFSCLLYGFISISITFFNKAVLSSYSFHYPNIMTATQIIFSLAFLFIMKSFKLISYAEFNMKTSRRTSLLSISFLLMVLTGLQALNYLNIPMFNALRRLTTLFTMSGEYYLIGTLVSRNVKYSVYLMVIGAAIAGLYDFDYHPLGYICKLYIYIIISIMYIQVW